MYSIHGKDSEMLWCTTGIYMIAFVPDNIQDYLMIIPLRHASISTLGNSPFNQSQNQTAGDPETLVHR